MVQIFGRYIEKPSDLAKLLPTYGFWGGQGFSGEQHLPDDVEPNWNIRAKDDLDRAYKVHDKAYWDAEQEWKKLGNSPAAEAVFLAAIVAADKRLIADARIAIDTDPTISLYGQLYGRLSIAVFEIKVATNQAALDRWQAGNPLPDIDQNGEIRFQDVGASATPVLQIEQACKGALHFEAMFQADPTDSAVDETPDLADSAATGEFAAILRGAWGVTGAEQVNFAAATFVDQPPPALQDLDIYWSADGQALGFEEYRDNAAQGTATQVGSNTWRPVVGTCFVGETPVLMADGKTKAIRDVVAGDLVMAFDPEEPFGPLAPRRVAAVHVRDGAEVVEVAGLRATDRHRRFRVRRGAWGMSVWLRGIETNV